MIKMLNLNNPIQDKIDNFLQMSDHHKIWYDKDSEIYFISDHALADAILTSKAFKRDVVVILPDNLEIQDKIDIIMCYQNMPVFSENKLYDISLEDKMKSHMEEMLETISLETIMNQVFNSIKDKDTIDISCDFIKIFLSHFVLDMFKLDCTYYSHTLIIE